MTARDPFEKYRDDCVLNLVADRALTATALRIGIVIAQHLNRETRDAWPSKDTIARLTKEHPRHLPRGFEALREHIEVIIPGKPGRGHVTHYRFRLPFPDATTASFASASGAEPAARPTTPATVQSRAAASRPKTVATARPAAGPQTKPNDHHAPMPTCVSNYLAIAKELIQDWPRDGVSPSEWKRTLGERLNADLKLLNRCSGITTPAADIAEIRAFALKHCPAEPPKPVKNKDLEDEIPF
jgi:hypothetical protein